MTVNCRLQIRQVFSLHPAVGSVMMSLLRCFPGSATEFFTSGELFHGMYELGAAVSCHNVLPKLCIYQRWSMRSADHRSGEVLQLQSTETSFTTVLVCNSPVTAEAIQKKEINIFNYEFDIDDELNDNDKNTKLNDFKTINNLYK